MQTFILHYNIISVQIALDGVFKISYKCTLPSSRRMRTAPDPKLGINIGGHYWLTKVRSEVPFRTPCSLQSVNCPEYLGV